LKFKNPQKPNKTKKTTGLGLKKVFLTLGQVENEASYCKSGLAEA